MQAHTSCTELLTPVYSMILITKPVRSCPESVLQAALSATRLATRFDIDIVGYPLVFSNSSTPTLRSLWHTMQERTLTKKIHVEATIDTKACVLTTSLPSTPTLC